MNEELWMLLFDWVKRVCDSPYLAKPEEVQVLPAVARVLMDYPLESEPSLICSAFVDPSADVKAIAQQVKAAREIRP